MKHTRLRRSFEAHRRKEFVDLGRGGLGATGVDQFDPTEHSVFGYPCHYGQAVDA